MDGLPLVGGLPGYLSPISESPYLRAPGHNLTKPPDWSATDQHQTEVPRREGTFPGSCRTSPEYVGEHGSQERGVPRDGGPRHGLPSTAGVHPPRDTQPTTHQPTNQPTNQPSVRPANPSYVLQSLER